MQNLNKTDVLALSANNLIFEEQKWFSLNRNTLGVTTGSGSYSAQQLLSYMGRIDYNYKSKYYLTLSNRYDNSSVLAEGSKGQWFPSAAVAWRMDNEAFFMNQRVINAAKLRIGYGLVGNSSIPPYRTNGPLDFTNYNWTNGTAVVGLAPTTFKTPGLTWEKRLPSMQASILDYSATGYPVVSMCTKAAPPISCRKCVFLPPMG
ncbi:hypothetical protein [Paraflavitalea speifideaquila]|uniref:hypothetical protein n=1 Tax=Paraflavitalea speifideaquila TaxID=3076558 RepID=UPI0028E632C0|nr:hypothetical protein [Paraflavitalea speifideiaquila]